MSTPCPACHKTLLVEDIVVKGYTGVTNLETCGKLIVRRKGHAVAKHRVVALAGIEVQGRLHCEHALTAGHTVIDKKAQWMGDLHATSLVVEAGAVISGGRFKIPEDPLAAFRYQEKEQEEAEAAGGM
jgi:cytoskeletal protein CcmA (bactofilin family)